MHRNQQAGISRHDFLGNSRQEPQGRKQLAGISKQESAGMNQQTGISSHESAGFSLVHWQESAGKQESAGRN